MLLYVPELTAPLEIFLNMACAYRENRTLRSPWYSKTCNTSTARHEYDDDVYGLDTARFVVR